MEWLSLSSLRDKGKATTYLKAPSHQSQKRSLMHQYHVYETANTHKSHLFHAKFLTIIVEIGPAQTEAYCFTYYIE